MEKLYNEITLDSEDYNSADEFDLALGRLLHQLADNGSEIRFCLDDLSVYWIQFVQNRFNYRDIGASELRWLTLEETEELDFRRREENSEEPCESCTFK